MADLITGVQSALAPSALLFTLLGTVLGIVFGALPGLTSVSYTHLLRNCAKNENISAIYQKFPRNNDNINHNFITKRQKQTLFFGKSPNGFCRKNVV